MARLFDDASNEYLAVDQAAVSAAPFAATAWFSSDDGSAAQSIVFIGDKDADDSLDVLRLSAGQVNYLSIAGGMTDGFNVAAYSTNTWTFVAMVRAADNDRRAWANATRTTSSTTALGTGWDRMAIGLRARLSALQYFSGKIAEVAFWNLANWPGATNAAKADEFERLAIPALGDGFSPLHFRLGLVAYWPLGGLLSDDNAANDASGDRDIVGGYHMSPYNTPSVADHLGIIYPRRALSFPTAAAEPVLTYRNLILGGGVF